MAEHDGQTINVGEAPWVRFNPAKMVTWPPTNTLVLLSDSRVGYTLGSWQSDSDLDGGGAWYDENSDRDEDWEVDDERWWRPLPTPPGGSDG